MPPSQAAGLPLRFRIAFILLGILIFGWLPVEEHSLVPLLLLSACAAILGLLAVLSRQQPRENIAEGGENKRGSLFYPLAGLVAGAAVTLIALALLAVKTGIHGHGVSDYSPAQVVQVLGLTPAWMGLGFILGGLAAAGRR